MRFCRTCCRQHCQALQHCQVPQLAWQLPTPSSFCFCGDVSRKLHYPTPKRQCLHLGQAGTLVVVVWSQASYPSPKKISCFDLVYLLDRCFVKASSFINKIQWRASLWTVVYPTISCREKNEHVSFHWVCTVKWSEQFSILPDSLMFGHQFISQSLHVWSSVYVTESPQMDSLWQANVVIIFLCWDKSGQKSVVGECNGGSSDQCGSQLGPSLVTANSGKGNSFFKRKQPSQNKFHVMSRGGQI